MKARKLFSLLSGIMIMFTSLPSGLAYAEDVDTEIKIWDGTADISWYDYEETEFHLTTPEQFAGLSKLAYEGKVNFKGCTVYIDDDMWFNEKYDTTDYDGKQYFQPIQEFSGTLLGNNHVLHNIAINSDHVPSGIGMYNAIGLICTLSGNASNIKIDKIDFQISDYNRQLIGSLCGYSSNNSNINSVIISGSVFFLPEFKDNTNSQPIRLGGLCGINYGSISNCINNTEINFDINNYSNTGRGVKCSLFIGGITGEMSEISISSSIFRCSNNGRINHQFMDENIPSAASDGVRSTSYNGDFGVGGICGRILAGDIIECSNHGTILMSASMELDDNTYLLGYYSYSSAIGGIIGTVYPSDSHVLNCYNNAYVETLDSLNRSVLSTGGIIGNTYFGNITTSDKIKDIENSISSMEIANNYCVGGTMDEKHGGIIGAVDVRVKGGDYFVGSSNYYLNTLTTRMIGRCITYVSSLEYYKIDIINDLAMINSYENKIKESVVSSGSKSEANMKKPEFAQKLGYAFAYVEGDYPKLAWEVGITYGDVNLDETVDIADAVQLQKALLTEIELNEKAAYQADLDFNGIINAVDLTLLKRMIPNKEEV